MTTFNPNAPSTPVTTGQDLRAALASGQVKPLETGAPFGVRALVGGVSRPEDQLATLQKAFPIAERDPVSGRLVFIDPQSGDAVFVNPSGLDVGDIPSIAREGVQGVGGSIGAALGAAGGPGGAIAGAGLGTAIGEEAFNAAARAFGAVDTRTLGERAAETAVLGATGGAGQGAGIAAGALLGSAFKGAARSGTSRSEIEQAVTDLAKFDAVPTVAQATQSQFLDSLESILAKTPGGAGRFRKVVTDTTGRVARSIERRVEDLGGRVGIDPEFVGRVVQKGIDNPLGEGFIQRFQAQAEALYNKIGIPDNQAVSTSNTSAALRELNQLPDVPAVNALVTSPTVRSLSGEIPETIEFSVLQRMRSAVGRSIGNPTLVPDVPTADLKNLYAAISRDMEAAAAAAGGGALRRFNRANRFYSAGSDRIEGSLQKLNSQVTTANATPEQVFLTLERGLVQGPTRIRTVMRSLKPDERRVLAAGVIRRIGNPRPGQALSEGPQFSFETFLTNWERLDDAAKQAMFGFPELRAIGRDFDALARAASRVRESSQAFKNPSGTAAGLAGTTASFIGGGSGIIGLLTGDTPMLAFPAVLAVGALGANATARLMTSPRFVRWLARSTEITPNGMGAHIGRLSGIASVSDPDTKEAILGYLNVLNSTAPGGQSGGTSP